jgi:hypothetical protein
MKAKLLVQRSASSCVGGNVVVLKCFVIFLKRKAFIESLFILIRAGVAQLVQCLTTG